MVTARTRGRIKHSGVGRRGGEACLLFLSLLFAFMANDWQACISCVLLQPLSCGLLLEALQGFAGL